MARIDIHNLWDRDMRIAIDKNFIQLFNEYTQAGLNAEDARQKAIQAVAESLTAKLTADEAKSIAERVSTELGQAILEGDSSPLGGQLSVGADGTVYNDPQDRFVKEMNSVNQNLAQTEDEFFKSSLVSHKGQKPMVLWIDDDGHRGVYTKIAPLLREFNIKMSAGIITNRAHGFPIPGLPAYNPTNQFMSYAEMKELEDEGIVEFIAHSHTHDINHRLTDMSIEEMHVELKTNRDIMRRLGWNYRHFVYPFGSENETVHSVVRQYFRSAFDIGGGIVTTPLNQYKIPRIGVDGDRTAQEVIDQIDAAIESNSLAVLTTHVDQYGGLDMQKMRAITEHVLNKGVQFVTADEAIEEFGNYLQIAGDSISHDGEIHGNRLGVYRNGHLDFTPNEDVAAFKEGTVTRLKVRSFELEAYGLPSYVVSEGGYGYIEVHRDSTEDHFSYQRFVNTVTKKELIRKWVSSGEYGEWESFGNVILEPNSVTSNDKPNRFPFRTMSIVHLADTYANGFPNDIGGVLQTYRIASDDSSTYQEYKHRNTNNIYVRTWSNSSQIWGDWDSITSFSHKAVNELNGGILAEEFGEGVTHGYIRANTTGLPQDKQSGNLVTYKQNGASRSYQTFRTAGTEEIYIRSESSDGSWRSWKKFVLEDV